MLRTTIDAVCVGTVDAFGPNGEPSAIRKKRMTGPFRVDAEGPAGDAHGDTVHHGGSEKAVHHYPFEHYHLWQTELPTAASHFEQPPFFGENISTTGLTETSVCVGDIFRAGTVLLQVSEVRQPCWKLAHRSGVPDLARRVQETGRTGWFYRVIETGTIEVGVTMELAERPQPEWPLSRIISALYHTPLDRAELEGIAGLPELTAGQRGLAQRRLDTGSVEPWERRLTVPAG